MTNQCQEYDNSKSIKVWPKMSRYESLEGSWSGLFDFKLINQWQQQEHKTKAKKYGKSTAKKMMAGQARAEVSRYD